MKLNESGASAYTTCPLCEYPGAIDEYDSHRGYTYGDKDFQVYMTCYLCGFTKYGDKDDASGEEEIEPRASTLLVAKKIMKLFNNMNKDAEGQLIDFVQMIYEDDKPTSVSLFSKMFIDHIFS